MRRLRRPLVPFTLIAALAALLVFAATAAAEIKIGEGTSPAEPKIAGEADLLKGTAEFDLATGRVNFDITTRLPQESTPEEERPQIQYTAALATPNFPCTEEAFREASEKASKEGTAPSVFPALEVFSANFPFPVPPPGLPLVGAYGRLFNSAKELEENSSQGFVAGSKTVNGTTASASVTVPQAVNGPFTCAEILVQNFDEAGESDFLLFPLTTKPEPPPVVPDTTQPAPPPPAKPAPKGILSIAKAKPLKLAAGKWKTVKVKITNSGDAAIAQGTLGVKAPNGVIVKPGRQKVPALLPGESWTVSVRVKLTAKAKKTSKVTLTAAGGGLTGKTSLVIKAAKAKKQPR
jgi:hypothetical protein